MAKDLTNAPGIGVDAAYPHGKIVNGETLVGEHVNRDIATFFQRLMDQTGITPNDQFDNNTHGYQLIEALGKYITDRQKPTLEMNVTDYKLWRVVKGDPNGLRTVKIIVEIQPGVSAAYTGIIPTEFRPAEHAVVSYDNVLMQVESTGTLQLSNPKGVAYTLSVDYVI